MNHNKKRNNNVLPKNMTSKRIKYDSLQSLTFCDSMRARVNRNLGL